MPILIAHTSRRYATTLGHVLQLRRNQEFYAAPEVAELILKDGIASLKEGEQPVATPAPVVPEAAPASTLDQEKILKIAEAMQEMMDEGNIENFTTTGEPRARVLESLLGFDTSKEEREVAWGMIESA